MTYSDVSKKATYKYRQKIEELRFSVPKGEKQRIVDHAASRGESINSFLRRAVEETIERDNTGSSDAEDEAPSCQD